MQSGLDAAGTDVDLTICPSNGWIITSKSLGVHSIHDTHFQEKFKITILIQSRLSGIHFHNHLEITVTRLESFVGL